MVKPIPDGHHAVTAHLTVSDGVRAIQFYRRGLAASESYRFCTRQGKIVHAELQVAGYRFTLSDEAPGAVTKSARTYGGCSMTLRVYADDVEALARLFVAAGGFIVQPLTLQPDGDLSGQFRDPEGYCWTLAQHVEDVPLDQLEQRLGPLGISMWRPRSTELRRPTRP